MKTERNKSEKNRLQRRAKRTPKRLKEAALDIFSEKSVHAVTVEEITEKADLGKGTLYRYFEDNEQVSIYLSPRIAPRKVRRLECAVAGFVFGFFSFAIIGMTSKEIETSITPLRQVFVKSLVTFLGR